MSPAAKVTVGSGRWYIRVAVKDIIRAVVLSRELIIRREVELDGVVARRQARKAVISGAVRGRRIEPYPSPDRSAGL